MIKKKKHINSDEKRENNIIRRNNESALTGRPKTCYKQHQGKE